MSAAMTGPNVDGLGSFAAVRRSSGTQACVASDGIGNWRLMSDFHRRRISDDPTTTFILASRKGSRCPKAFG